MSLSDPPFACLLQSKVFAPPTAFAGRIGEGGSRSTRLSSMRSARLTRQRLEVCREGHVRDDQDPQWRGLAGADQILRLHNHFGEPDAGLDQRLALCDFTVRGRPTIRRIHQRSPLPGRIMPGMLSYERGISTNETADGRPICGRTVRELRLLGATPSCYTMPRRRRFPALFHRVTGSAGSSSESWRPARTA